MDQERQTSHLVPHVQDVRLSSMLGTLFVSSGVQAIKSAHPYVRSRTHFQTCLAGTPRSNLVLPLRGTIYNRKHLFSSEELFITMSIYFLIKQPLVRQLSPMLSEDVPAPLYTTRKSILTSCSMKWMHVPLSASHVAHPFPPEEVDPVLFTYMCSAQRALYHLCSVRRMPVWPRSLRRIPFALEVLTPSSRCLTLEALNPSSRQLLAQLTSVFQMPRRGQST